MSDQTISKARRRRGRAQLAVGADAAPAADGDVVRAVDRHDHVLDRQQHRQPAAAGRDDRRSSPSARPSSSSPAASTFRSARSPAFITSMAVAWLLTHDLGFADLDRRCDYPFRWRSASCIGVFHGFGIVQMGLPPFIMTLATMYAVARHRPADHQRRDDLDHQRRLHRLLARELLGFPGPTVRGSRCRCCSGW